MYHPFALRSPASFDPRMISTPNPGLPSFPSSVMGGLYQGTPHRYQTPIPTFTPGYMRTPSVTSKTVTFTSPSTSVIPNWETQMNLFDQSTGVRTHVSETVNRNLLSLREEGTQTSSTPLYTGSTFPVPTQNNIKYPTNTSHMEWMFDLGQPPLIDTSIPTSITASIATSIPASIPTSSRLINVDPVVSEVKQPHAQSILKCEHSCKPKEVEAPTFNGKEKWDTFISLFQKVAELNKWDNTARCERLLVALRGSALEFVDTLQLKVAKDYDLLKQALAQRFGITSNEALYRVKFKGRRRNNNETLDKYIQDLQYLAERAYPSERSSIYHRLIVDQFIEGIGNRDCKQYLQLNLNLYKENDSSLIQEVLKYAHNYESVMGSCDRIRKPYEDNNTNVIKPNDTSLRDQKNGKGNSNGHKEGRREPSKIICFKCAQEGHIATRCPLNQQNVQEN